MKKLTNNQILIGEIVEQELKENTNYNRIDDFFEFFTASHVLRNYDLSDEEIEGGIKGAGLDGGCDGIFIFTNGILVNDDMIESISFPKRLHLNFLYYKQKTQLVLTKMRL